MASSPTTSWQIDGGKVETVKDFTFLGTKITADVDSCHEIQRRLLLAKKSYGQPTRKHNKGRDITLLTKVYLIKAVVFLIVMYGCESWTIMKAEH